MRPHTTPHTNYKFPENIKLNNCLIQWGQTANQHFNTRPQTQLCVISSTQLTGILVGPNISTGLWQRKTFCCTLNSVSRHHQLCVWRTNTQVKYSTAHMQQQLFNIFLNLFYLLGFTAQRLKICRTLAPTACSKMSSKKMFEKVAGRRKKSTIALKQPRAHSHLSYTQTLAAVYQEIRMFSPC